MRTKVNIVSCRVGRRPIQRSPDFRGLQRWLNHSGDTDRHLVLQIEDGFERTVKALRPEMRAGENEYQLRSDALPPTDFANGTYKHKKYTKIAPDMFHI